MRLAPTTWLQSASERTLDLLFPPTCVSCQADIEENKQKLNLCHACREQLQLNDWPTCRRCAARVPEIPGAVSECAHCREDKLWFDRAFALGDYEGLLNELVLKMKSDRSERLARMFSKLLFRKIGPAIRDLGPTAIVPIPIPRMRRITRGTNPAEALATGISQKLGLKVLRRVLSCRRNTQPQKELSRPARFRNVHGQIWARAGYPLVSAHVLLVDDVLTTGATCSEAARVLKQRGVAKVSVLVIARTPSG